jgi:hypothetical protein
MPPALGVRTGQITALRLFDVAYEIDLARAEALWARHARFSTRSRLSTTPPKAMSFGVPPLALTLKPAELALDGIAVGAAVTVRLYDFGVAAIALRIPVAEQSWAQFTALVNQLDRAVGHGAGAALWDGLLAETRRLVGEAFERPSAAVLSEDYLMGTVHAFSAPVTAAGLLEAVDLVPLLSGEQRPLAEGARQELLRQRFSYYTDDLVVLTWDRAFIYEPRADSDVADVLEVANAQLLEMRYYDELLDAELPRMYDLVESTRRTVNLLAPGRFANLARRLYTLVAEVTELTEKADNALQVTEDVYLARIYSAALDLFRVRTVSAAVDRKLSIIRDTYAALYDEANSSRAGLLELLVLILICVEVVIALVH